MDGGTGLARMRRKAGLSQVEVARRCGLSQSAYSRLESGNRGTGTEMLRRLARVLGVGLDAVAAATSRKSGGRAERAPGPADVPDLGTAGADGEAHSPGGSRSYAGRAYAGTRDRARTDGADGVPAGVRMLPLLGRIPAGAPTEADADSDVYPVPAHLAGPGRYVLRVSGHSMAPEVKDGDHIVVQHLRDARPDDLQGRVCICLLDGRNTLKRVFVETRRGRRVVVLRGDNPESPAVVVGEGDDLELQGRAVAVVGREL